MGGLEIWHQGPISLLIGVVLFLLVGTVLAVIIGIPYRLITGRSADESNFVIGLAFALAVLLALMLEFG